MTLARELRFHVQRSEGTDPPQTLHGNIRKGDTRTNVTLCSHSWAMLPTLAGRGTEAQQRLIGICHYSGHLDLIRDCFKPALPFDSQRILDANGRPFYSHSGSAGCAQACLEGLGFTRCECLTIEGWELAADRSGSF